MLLRSFRFGNQVQGFQSVWDTTNGFPMNEITIPTRSTGTYNCTVYWGDGNQDTITTWNDPAWTHVYAAPGIYTVIIEGKFSEIYFNGATNIGKIINIDYFGDVGWESFEGAFYRCDNMDISANAIDGTDFSAIQNWFRAFRDCDSVSEFPLLDTSAATTLEQAWLGCQGITSFPLIDVTNCTDFTQTWSTCTNLASFPLIDFSGKTNFDTTWRNCTALTSFPLIDTSSAVNVRQAWQGCNGLTSFPLLDFSSCLDFESAWFGCTGLTSFPAIDFTAAQSFFQAWRQCTGLTANGSFPGTAIGSTMANVTSLSDAFRLCTLDSDDYSDFLVAIEAVNSNNGVNLNGGNSEYNPAGGVARAALIADHSWAITDGGPV